MGEAARSMLAGRGGRHVDDGVLSRDWLHREVVFRMEGSSGLGFASHNVQSIGLISGLSGMPTRMNIKGVWILIITKSYHHTCSCHGRGGALEVRRVSARSDPEMNVPLQRATLQR